MLQVEDFGAPICFNQIETRSKLLSKPRNHKICMSHFEPSRVNFSPAAQHFPQMATSPLHRSSIRSMATPNSVPIGAD